MGQSDSTSACAGGADFGEAGGLSRVKEGGADGDGGPREARSKREEEEGEDLVMQDVSTPVPSFGSPAVENAELANRGPSYAPQPCSSAATTQSVRDPNEASAATCGYESDNESLSSAHTSLCGNLETESDPFVDVFSTDIYPEERSFGRHAAFVTSCRDRLASRFRYASRTFSLRAEDDQMSDAAATAVVLCSRTATDRCPFKVLARKQDDRFHVDHVASRWLHRHIVDYEDGSLEWTASTESVEMAELVESRPEIFALQRKLATAAYDSRHASSLAALETYFSSLAASNTVSRSSFQRYSTFCATARIPPLPISSALVALCLFERCSQQNGNYQTLKQDLQRFGRLTATFWTDVALAEEIANWKDASLALAEFMDERKDVQLRGAKRSRPDSSSSDDSEASAGASTWSDSDEEEVVVKKPARASSAGRSSGATSTVELPNSTQVFPSLTDVFKVLVKATVPTLGVSGECRFTFALKKEGKSGWRLDSSRSYLTHNHGPTPQLLADPSWRPTVRNPQAREALGMPPLPGYPTSATGENYATTQEPPPGAGVSGVKKQRLEKGSKWQTKSKAVVTTSDEESDSPAAPSPSRAPRLLYSPPASPAPPPLPADLSDAQQPIDETLHNPSRPDAASFLHPAPVHSLFSFDTTEFSAAPELSTHLHSFLSAIHPSLAPFAPTLAASGLDSVDSLASLASFEPEILSLYLDPLSLKGENGEDGGRKMSVLQRRLLEKGLRGANM
ncbi:hypothetical protein JCM6882_008708 [Rhodosporidiobolus microsporus]